MCGVDSVTTCTNEPGRKLGNVAIARATRPPIELPMTYTLDGPGRPARASRATDSKGRGGDARDWVRGSGCGRSSSRDA